MENNLSKPTQYVVIGALLACAVAIILAIKDEIRKGVLDAKRAEQKRRLETENANKQS